MTKFEQLGRETVTDLVLSMLLGGFARTRPDGDAWLREQFIIMRNVITKQRAEVAQTDTVEAAELERAALATLDELFAHARQLMAAPPERGG